MSNLDDHYLFYSSSSSSSSILMTWHKTYNIITTTVNNLRYSTVKKRKRKKKKRYKWLVFRHTFSGWLDLNKTKIATIDDDDDDDDEDERQRTKRKKWRQTRTILWRRLYMHTSKSQLMIVPVWLNVIPVTMICWVFLLDLPILRLATSREMCVCVNEMNWLSIASSSSSCRLSTRLDSPSASLIVYIILMITMLHTLIKHTWDQSYHHTRSRSSSS